MSGYDLIGDLENIIKERDALRAENEMLRAALKERCPVDAMDREGMTPAQAAIWHVWGERCPDFEPGCMTCRAWAELDRTACLAMLRAWPGVGSIRVDQPIGEWCEKLPAIILPMPAKDNEG